MLLGFAFTDSVSVGSIIAIIVSIATIAAVFKSGGPWRAVAEGYKEERDQLRAENAEYRVRIGVLEAKPDLQAISDVLTTITSSLAAIVVSLQHLQETQVLIDSRMHDHEQAAQERSIELIELVRATRDPRTRTRAGDA